MARRAQYPDQLVIQVGEAMGTELRHLGDLTGLGISEVTRQCIEEGLPTVRKRLKSQVRRSAQTAS